MNEPGRVTPGKGGGPSGSPPPGDSIILSSRASISRNLSNHKFPGSCSNEEKKQVIGIIRDSAAHIASLPELCFLSISRMKKIQRQVLLDDYQIGGDFISEPAGRGILLKPKGSIGETALAIPLCWEDHMKIQAAAPGNSIDDAYPVAADIEKLFESRLSFSFSQEWGYLTADPADLGTAMEISLMVHLPALAISPEIEEFIKKLSRVGCAVGGYSGRDSEVTGNIFMISSSRTLGKSEQEIVEEMNAICLNIIDEEKDARSKLIRKDRLGAKDNVYRSYGLLKYARILSFDEALELLSILRLGIDLGMIDRIKDFDLFEMMNLVGDAHIVSGFEMGDRAADDEIDLKRAELIREKILED